MLLRLAYLWVTNALALLRLLPMSDRDTDAEILALRHQMRMPRKLDHGTVDPVLPARVNRPDVDLESAHLLYALREYERHHNIHRPTEA